MKKLITIYAAILMTANVFAQSPEKMSYQAVIRDGSNSLVISTEIGMQISILQGSASGSAFYVETQTSTTNANGLVSLEIGTGTTADDFSTIDWSNGPYFVKTETDPTGGTSYTITGTSQLLSVPYAMHAKSAETLTGEINETDPVFEASIASKITDAVITYWTNKQDKLTAGTNISIEENTISVTEDTLAIGDSYQGGIIFWLDASGKHGLIAAPTDQSAGLRWHNGTSSVTNAVRDGVGAGIYNTERIIAKLGTGNYAAQLCANYLGGDYGDWYLPSKHELNLLRDQQAVVGGFTSNDYYWSSSETSDSQALAQFFTNGDQAIFTKINTHRVRAIRAF